MLLPTTPIKTKAQLAEDTDKILSLIREHVSDPRKVRDLSLALGTLDALAGIGLTALTNGAEGKAADIAQDVWVAKISKSKAAAYGFKV